MSLSQRLARVQPVMPGVQRTFIPFGEWLPDLGSFNNPGVYLSPGFFPVGSGFKSVKNVSVASDAIDNRPQGLVAARDTASNIYVYSGDSSKIYSLTSQVWGDVSKGGGYNTAADDVWSFVQFNNKIIATNFADPVQAITLGGANFADLITSTNKPKARYVAATRNFLILGNTNDTTDGAKPNRVWWSAIGDETDFDPAASTQSDYQDIETGGWIRAIVAFAEYALIFMDSSVVRMTYEGPPTIFRFDVIDSTRGTPFPGSVISQGRNVYFISEEGFMVTDGVSVRPIGHNKVDNDLFAYTDGVFFDRFSSAIDPLNKLILFGAPSPQGILNRTYIYSWAEQKFSLLEHLPALSQYATILTQGYTLDGLDVLGTDIDDSGVFANSFDSRLWSGGLLQLAAMDSNKKLVLFDSTPSPACGITTSFQRFGRQKSRVLGFRIHSSGLGSPMASVTASIFSTSDPGTATTTITSLDVRTALDSYIPVPTGSDNWYHRFSLTWSAGLSDVIISGIDVDWVPTGAY